MASEYFLLSFRFVPVFGQHDQYVMSLYDNVTIFMFKLKLKFKNDIHKAKS